MVLQIICEVKTKLIEGKKFVLFCFETSLKALASERMSCRVVSRATIHEALITMTIKVLENV